MKWKSLSLMDSPENCYSCFMMLNILPSRDGFADLSTCQTNVDKRANRVIVSAGINLAWNHAVFRHQRSLVLNSKWPFCSGNRCMPFRMYPDFEALCNEPDVLQAREMRQTRLSYLPKALWITTSYDCNNHCSFCYQKQYQAHRYQFRLNEKIISELKHDLIPQAKQVVFTGGEPLLNDLEIIRFVVRNYPHIKLGIGTNGILLDRYGIDQIIKDKIHLTISVYGFDEKIYNRLTESNNHKFFMRNLCALIDKGYAKEITLDYMIRSQETLEVLPKFLTFIRQNPCLSAIVRDDHWSNEKYQRQMDYICENQFSDILSRIKIYKRGKNGLARFMGKGYNYLYDIKTSFLRGK